MALWLPGLLFESDDDAVRTDLRNAEASGINHLGQHRTSLRLAGNEGSREVVQAALILQHIVTEDDRDGIVVGKSLRQADGVGDPESTALVPVGEMEPDTRPVMQELQDVTHRSTTHDDHDLSTTDPPEGRKRVIDHRSVEHGEEVLVRYQGQREQTRTAPAASTTPFNGAGPRVTVESL